MVKLESIIVDTNKQATLKIIENQLDLFAIAIKKKNFEIKNLRDSLDVAQKERVKTARAYAKQLGVLKKRK